MPITATSARAVATQEVRNLVANSATFIAAVGAIDFEDAKASIYLVEKFPDESEPVDYERPLCLVLLAMFEYRVSKPGYPAGQIDFQLEIDTITEVDGSPATPEQQAIDAFNFFGGVESDISQLGSPIAAATNDALLRFDRLRQTQPIRRSRDTGSRDYWMSRYSLVLL